MFTSEDKNILQSLTQELRRSNDLKEKELKHSRVTGKRERRRIDGWLFADEVVKQLRPYVTETQTLKILREKGLVGMEQEGFKQHGRAYFYNPKAIEKLLQQFKAGTLEPIKRK